MSDEVLEGRCRILCCSKVPGEMPSSPEVTGRRDAHQTYEKVPAHWSDQVCSALWAEAHRPVVQAWQDSLGDHSTLGAERRWTPSGSETSEASAACRAKSVLFLCSKTSRSVTRWSPTPTFGSTSTLTHLLSILRLSVQSYRWHRIIQVGDAVSHPVFPCSRHCVRVAFAATELKALLSVTNSRHVRLYPMVGLAVPSNGNRVIDRFCDAMRALDSDLERGLQPALAFGRLCRHTVASLHQGCQPIR